jgi:hypothetical protein
MHTNARECLKTIRVHSCAIVDCWACLWSNFAAARRGALAALLFALLALAPPSSAHQGPPYPIIVDQRAGPYLLSVWSDPDVGIGTFFVTFESSANGPISDDLTVDIAVQPVTGRLPEARHPTAREELRDSVQFLGEVPFDAQEWWHVRVIVASAAGGGEVSTDVEVTPPGLGPWDILLYFFPFGAVGFLWIRAVLARRSQANR